MKREKLKEALKPVIVECVREALYEEGVLSSIISEVVSGLGAGMITESAPKPEPRPEPIRESRVNHNETRRKLLEAVSADAYGGVDLFEGVTPAPAQSTPTAGDPLGDADPRDPGIDISGIMAIGGKKWKALSGRN